MRRTALRLLALSWLAVSFLSAASAQEWTRFRGPNGTGETETSTIPASWTEKDVNWKIELPGIGHSSPVLWGDKIFLTSSGDSAGGVSALCLAAADGKLLWKHD